MKINRIAALFLTAVVTVALLSSCSLFKRDDRTRINVLMVTGNFFDSRLICELAQYKTKQPIIVVDPESNGAVSIYYAPSSEAKTIQIANEEFGDFIDHLNPRTIAVMGGSKFVPANILDILNKKNGNVVQLTNDDWEKNAHALGVMLNQDRLVRTYREYREKFIQAGELPAN